MGCSTLIHAEKVVGQMGIRKQQHSLVQYRVECVQHVHFSGLFLEHFSGPWFGRSFGHFARQSIGLSIRVLPAAPDLCLAGMQISMRLSIDSAANRL